MKIKTTLTAFTLAASTAACGGGDDTRIVTGKLRLTEFGRTSATVVAVSDDGTRHEMPVGDDGEFEIAVPTGQRHAIGFRDDDAPRFFATLVNGAERRPLFELEADDDDIDIGAVSPVEAGDDTGEAQPSDDEVSSCRLPTGSEDDRETMVLVTGELPLGASDDDAPLGDDSPLNDSDDDGRPDALDGDVDGDGMCEEPSDDGDDTSEGDAQDDGDDTSGSNDGDAQDSGDDD